MKQGGSISVARDYNNREGRLVYSLSGMWNTSAVMTIKNGTREGD